MTTQQIQLFLVDLAIILLLARLLGMAARKLGQPQVVGEILAGLLLGPSLFHGSITMHLFPLDLRPSLTAIADIGLVLFMFIIGYELDRELIRGKERIAATVSLGSIALPLVLGSLLGIWLAHRNHVHHVLPFALFVGASMSVTAFPVLARILSDRGLHRTRIGGLAVASAAVDDISAWVLLAVVVVIGGAHGTAEWHILLAPAYLLVVFLVVRPLLGMVNERYRRLQRLTPDLLAVVLVGLLLSAFATEWMGVHFIFGAFIFGTAMPRKNGAALRQSILERLEQLSVLLLLPVFFVVAGLSVDLTKVGAAGLLQLVAILAVAVVGKFVGAYLGAASSGLSRRHSAVLGTLMNTRGLTEIVILTVGLQLKVLPPPVFSLMVVMALVTTAMTGPLLRLVYPPRLVQRDLADAAHAALAASTAYRVVVVLDSADDRSLVDTGLDIAAARRPAQLVLSRLVPQPPATRLEVGTGLGAELLMMTSAMAELHALAERGASREVEVTVFSQFSEDLATGLTQHIVGADPDFVVLPESVRLAPHDLLPRTVVRRVEGPAEPTAVAVLGPPGTTAASLALQVGAQIAVSHRLALVLVGDTGRRERASVAELARHGIAAALGDLPPGALIVGTATDLQAHLVVHARPDDEASEVEDWVALVAAQNTLHDSEGTPA